MEDHALCIECQIFCEYLVHQNPDTYITQKYQQAHQFGNIPFPKIVPPFERGLMLVARIHPFMTRLADSYSRFLFPSSILRKKLVLLVAILESGKHNQGFSDMPEPATRMTFLTRCAFEGVVFLCITCMAFIFLFPIHLGCSLYGWMLLDNKPE
jgi:hypothetical protein